MGTIKTYDSGTNGYSWTGTNYQNQIASLIDVNEPIVVKEIWCYAAGRFGTASMKNCLWDKDGGLLTNTGYIGYPNGSDSVGGQSWQGGPVADYLLDPGQYHLGFWSDPSEERVWGQASGTVNNHEYFETATGGIEGWGSPDDINYDGAIMAYIVYEPANDPPTKPRVITPNGGEIIDGDYVVDWEGATDPNGDSLVHQIAVYDGSWTKVASGNYTSRHVNFKNFRETSVARVRVRAYDGKVYGPWDESDGVFTIRHNQAPTKPSGLSPDGGQTVNRANSQFFEWNHNDDEAQSKFDFQWRIQGAPTWNTFSQQTAKEYTYTSPNFFPEGIIEWQVRTYDQGDLQSPWSNSAIFECADQSATPEILQPTPGQVVSDPTLTVKWSSYDQQDYHLQLYNGQTLMYENQRASAVKAETMNYSLENNANYTVELQIRDSGGIWSGYDLIAFSTSFTEPAEPQVTLTPDDERGSIKVDVMNPVPSGTEPTVEYNDIYRRVDGGEWIKIATLIPRNFYYIDYTPGSGTLYDYRVWAHGENSATIYSITHTSYVTIKNAILSVVDDPAQWLKLKFDADRSFNHGVARTQMQFNGRRYPVSEFGEASVFAADLSYKVTSREDKDKLIAIATSRQALIYRDSKGRRMFTTIGNLSIQDTPYFPNIYEVSFATEQISYEEDLS